MTTKPPPPPVLPDSEDLDSWGDAFDALISSDAPDAPAVPAARPSQEVAAQAVPIEPAVAPAVPPAADVVDEFAEGPRTAAGPTPDDALFDELANREFDAALGGRTVPGGQDVALIALARGEATAVTPTPPALVDEGAQAAQRRSDATQVARVDERLRGPTTTPPPLGDRRAPAVVRRDALRRPTGAPPEAAPPSGPAPSETTKITRSPLPPEAAPAPGDVDDDELQFDRRPTAATPGAVLPAAALPEGDDAYDDIEIEAAPATPTPEAAPVAPAAPAKPAARITGKPAVMRNVVRRDPAKGRASDPQMPAVSPRPGTTGDESPFAPAARDVPPEAALAGEPRPATPQPLGVGGPRLSRRITLPNPDALAAMDLEALAALDAAPSPVVDPPSAEITVERALTPEPVERASTPASAAPVAIVDPPSAEITVERALTPEPVERASTPASAAPVAIVDPPSAEITVERALSTPPEAVPPLEVAPPPPIMPAVVASPVLPARLERSRTVSEALAAPPAPRAETMLTDGLTRGAALEFALPNPEPLIALAEHTDLVTDVLGDGGFARLRAVRASGGDPREDASERQAVLEAELAAAAGTPLAASLQLELGRLALLMGDRDRARQELEAALANDPGLTAAARLLRQIAVAAGDLADAPRHLAAEAATLAEGPRRRALLAQRAELLRLAGDPEARTAFAELAAIDPADPRVRSALLELAHDEGAAAFAAELVPVIEAAPDESRALYVALRAHLLMQDGDLAGARAALTSAVGGRVGGRAAALALAILEAGSGRAAEARAAAAQAATGSPPWQGALAYRAASRALAAGQADSALAQLGAVPPDVWTAELTALAAGAAGAAAAERDALDRWFAAEADPVWRTVAGRRSAQLSVGLARDAAEAESALRALLSYTPDDVGTRQALTALLVVSGRVEAAVELWRGAPEHDSMMVAEILEGAGRPEAALAELVEALPALAPADPTAVPTAVALALTAGEPLTAARVLAAYPDGAISSAEVARARASELAVGAGAGGVPATSDDTDGDGAQDLVLAWLREASAPGEHTGQVLATAAAAADPGLAAQLGLEAGEVAPGWRGQAMAALAARAGGDRPAAAAADLELASLARATGDGARARALELAAAVNLVADDPSQASELLGPPTELPAGGMPLSLELAHARDDRDAVAALLAAEAEVAAPVALAIATRVLAAESLGTGEAAGAAWSALVASAGDEALVIDGALAASAANGGLPGLSDRLMAGAAVARAHGEADRARATYALAAHVAAVHGGDAAAALVAQRELAGEGAAEPVALRAVERAAALAGDDAALARVDLAWSDAALAADERLAFALARLGAAWRAGAPRGEGALVAARAALEAAPDVPAALLTLELDAGARGDRLQLAELSDALALLVADDPRAAAAFATRAGQLRAEGGDTDGALLTLAHAAGLADAEPALRAWSRVALGAGRDADAAVALERLAAREAESAARARLEHLVGVLAMDRLGDPARAARALVDALVHDPAAAGSADVAARVARLLGGPGDEQALATALGARLAHAPRGEQLALHTLLAAAAERVSDGARAVRHLRAILALDEGQVWALERLAAHLEAQESWRELAEALATWTRLERRPARLRALWMQLGRLHGERLGNLPLAQKAFERVLALAPEDLDALEAVAAVAAQQGDTRAAMIALDQVAQLAPEPSRKVTALLAAAALFGQAGERQRAEAATRRALEVDASDPRVVQALVALYDGPALRVQMDRMAQLMRQRLVQQPLDGVAARTLSRALTARAQARVPGSVEGARFAAELAVLCGAGEEPERALAAEAQRMRALPGLGVGRVDDALFHPAVPSGARAAFRLLDDALSRRAPLELRRYGVGKADRLQRGASPIRDLVDEVILSLGLSEVELYVSQSVPTACIGEWATTPVVILGAQLADPARPALLRFAFGRALRIAQARLAFPAMLGEAELGLLVGAILRQVDPTFSPPGVPPAALAEETARLSKLVSKRLRDEIAPYLTEVSGAAYDPAALHLGLLASGDRAGLLAAGSLTAALQGVAILTNHQGIQSLMSDPRGRELCRFALSDEVGEVIRLALDH